MVTPTKKTKSSEAKLIRLNKSLQIKKLATKEVAGPVIEEVIVAAKPNKKQKNNK